MGIYAERALANHRKGYNCAQAVACAFADQTSMEETGLFRIMEGFGFGMGDSRDTCGALSGAVALAGIRNSDGNTEKPGTKKATYALAKEIKEKFLAKNQATVCRVLKGMDTGKMLRSCNGCIEDAVEIAEQVLFAEMNFSDKQTQPT